MSGNVYFVVNSLTTGGAEKQVLLLSRELADIGWKCTIVVAEDRLRNDLFVELLKAAEVSGVQVVGPFRVPTQFAKLVLVAAHLARMPAGILWCWGARAELTAKIVSLVGARHVLISSLRSASKQGIGKRLRVYNWRPGVVQEYVANSHRNITQFRELVCLCNHLNLSVLNNIVMKAPDQVGRLRERVFGVDSPLKIAVLGNNRFMVKGYDVLADAARVLKDRGRPVLFQIAGADYDGNLGCEIDKRGASDMIQCLGEVNDSIAFLSSCDAYVLSSRVEGMPNALLEAMSLGLPCIATDVGGVAECFVDGEHLLLARPGSVQSLCDKIELLLDCWPQCLAMGSSGRKRVEMMFSARAIGRQASEILRRVGGGSVG